MPINFTPEQIAAVQRLIRRHHIALAVELYGADAVPPEALADAIARGLLSPDVLKKMPRGALGDAYVLGVELHRDPDRTAGESVESFRERAGEAHAALSEWERRMAAAARTRGASFVLGLGNRVSDDFATVVISSDNAKARELKQVIAEQTAQSIEAREGWRTLRSRLGEELGEDWTRNLNRIAGTEIEAAVNGGMADAIEAMDGAGALVAVIPQPDACPTCLRSYLDGGVPRIFRLADLPTYGVNFKKPQREWVACVPPHHPNCHCKLVYVPGPGWWFDGDWTLQPPSVQKSVVGGEPLTKSAPRNTVVVLRLPEDLERRYDALGRSGDGPPHITVAFLGPLDANAVEIVRGTLRRTAPQFSPQRIGVGGVGHFVADDEVVAFAKVQAAGLDALRANLLAALAAGGVHDASDIPTFVPHVTVARIPAGTRWVLEPPAGVFTAGALELWCPGGREAFKLGTIPDVSGVEAI